MVSYRDNRGSSSHVNPEFDQLVVVLEGEGVLEIAGERYPLHAGEVAYLPKGTRRQIRADGDRLVYLVVNRRPS
ncbi:MAG: cupin domain-containing protein [Chloroflexota bacterium]|nr:cupin domain-containing protein [Dehalococcoidia bacterium]MDW8254254.1 cupin domain-containing protein [Chloroflexota bacterium]